MPAQRLAGGDACLVPNLRVLFQKILSVPQFGLPVSEFSSPFHKSVFRLARPPRPSSSLDQGDSCRCRSGNGTSPGGLDCSGNGAKKVDLHFPWSSIIVALPSGLCDKHGADHCHRCEC